jgi:hypothetical protein
LDRLKNLQSIPNWSGRYEKNIMSIQWWEKTVEYLFILRAAEAKKLFVMPLDGDQERAGDVIFSSGNRWMLIEFKKNAAAIFTEKAKFTNYDKAYAALSSRDAHHHIVYGEESKESNQHLQLYAQTYFSGKPSKLSNAWSDSLAYGAFKEYLEQYTKFKKGVKGGSGGLTITDYALVAGVNVDNHIVQCISLSEFQQHIGLELAQEHKQRRTLERDL